MPGQINTGGWDQAGNHAYDGVWYGIWQEGRYLLAREKGSAKRDGLERSVIPSGMYAAFQTKPGGLAWEELPKLEELIFDAWLPHAGYKQKSKLVVEVYHLWTDRAERSKKRYYELWIPIEKK